MTEEPQLEHQRQIQNMASAAREEVQKQLVHVDELAQIPHEFDSKDTTLTKPTYPQPSANDGSLATPAQTSRKQSRKAKGKAKATKNLTPPPTSLPEETETEQFSTRNLYIKGLPQQMTNESLQMLLSPYGHIVSSKAIMNRDTPTCKGFGFVMFSEPHDATKALLALSELGYSITFAKISRQRPASASATAKGKPAPQEDPTNLYFSNLPMSYDEPRLQSILAPYGKVISCRILRDYNTQASRGVGFARMADRGVCARVVREFSGIQLEEGAEPLQCKFADCPTHRSRQSRSAKHVLNTYESPPAQNLPQNVFIAQNGMMPMYSTPYYQMPQLHMGQPPSPTPPSLTTATPPPPTTTLSDDTMAMTMTSTQQQQQQQQLLPYNALHHPHGLTQYPLNQIQHHVPTPNGYYLTSNVVMLPQQQQQHYGYGGYVQAQTSMA